MSWHRCIALCCLAALVWALPRPGLCAGDQDDAALQAPLSAEARDLMRARILTRLNRDDEALAAYAALFSRQPDSDEIASEYLDLLEGAQNEILARTVLDTWLARRPGSALAQRRAAAFHVRAGNPELALPFYEELLRNDPFNTDVMLEYASALDATGAGTAATAMYANALDINRGDAALATLGRPALPAQARRAGFDTRFTELAKGVSYQTLHTEIFAPLGGGWGLRHEHSTVQGEQRGTEEIRHISKSFSEERITLSRRFPAGHEAMAWVGQTYGDRDQTPMGLGLSGVLRQNLSAGMTLKHNQQWYDIIDAMDRDGQTDEAVLNVGWRPMRRLLLSAVGTATRYYLDRDDHLGDRGELELAATYTLLARPRLDLTYSYQRARFSYAHDDERPVTMLEREEINSAFLSTTWELGRRFSLSLAGGGGQDTFKTSPFYFGSGSLDILVIPRLTARIGAFYINDSQTDAGGESSSFDAGLTWMF